MRALNTQPFHSPPSAPFSTRAKAHHHTSIKRAKPCQHVLNNSAQSLIFESFIPRRSLGLEMGGGCSAAAGAVAAESIAGGLGHG